MKATIIVPGRWHAFDLARELEGLGALHRIVTSYPRFKTRKWEIPDEKVISLPTQLVLTRLAWRVGGERLAMRLQFRINDIFARRAARFIDGSDVVHAWSGSAEPSLKRATALDIPTVLERSSAHMLEQCRILREEYARLGLRWEETPRKTVERELREYELATRISVPSRFVERSFVERRISPTKLRRIPLGVNTSDFSPGSQSVDLYRVIYAGSLSVQKGVHYLTQAFRAASLPNARLTLVGGASVDAHKLLGDRPENIEILGHIPQAELVSHYRRSSVFVLPSVHDGWGMVVGQALASGLPVICTRNTGGEDLLAMSGSAGVSRECGVREYPAGFVVPIQDVEALGWCIKKLHDHRDLLACKRDAAIRMRAADISWSSYAKGNLALYHELGG